MFLFPCKLNHFVALQIHCSSPVDSLSNMILLLEIGLQTMNFFVIRNKIRTTDHSHLNELYVDLVALVKKKTVKSHLQINNREAKTEFYS